MKPKCIYFRKCSGCTKLQFPYVKQLHDKTLAVRERFARFGAGRPVEAWCDDIVPSPLELGYRTSTKLCLNMDGFGQRTIGLYQFQSKTVVDIPQCPVQHDAINRLQQRLFAAPRARDGRETPPFYNHTKRSFQPGCLKFATIRHCPRTGEFGVVLSHTGIPTDELRAWLQGIRLEGVAVYGSELTRSDEDRVLSHRSTHLAGPSSFRYEVGQRRFTLTPEAFFQANQSLTDQFVANVTSFAAGSVGPGAVLLDLYGGFGAYALNAADGFARIQLVDANLPAIEAARQTAKDAGLKHLQAVHASTEDYLARLRSTEAAAITHIIVNPPRSGLSPAAVQQLGRDRFPNVRELIYVSCDPATLARDLAVLTRGRGLEVGQLTPFDMFPQTDHVEIVARLRPSADPLRVRTPATPTRGVSAVGPGSVQRPPPGGRPRPTKASGGPPKPRGPGSATGRSKRRSEA